MCPFTPYSAAPQASKVHRTLSLGTSPVVAIGIPFLCCVADQFPTEMNVGSHGEGTIVTQSAILKNRAEIYHVPGAIFC